MNATRKAIAMAIPQQYGQGTIEFQIIAAMILFPLLLFVVQIGLLIMAKNTLNVATLNAARAGAASGIGEAAMKDSLAFGLAPLNATKAKVAVGVGTGEITGGMGGNYPAIMGAALVKTRTENMLLARITVLNPTRKAFQDFGQDKAGKRVIPVTGVYDNGEVGPTSRQTRADALLLKIEVRYCAELAIPIINTIMREVLSSPWSGPSADDLICYGLERMPMNSQAVVRITVPPVRTALIRS
jgi:hypothetical protein